MLCTRVLDVLQRCQKLGYLHRSPHTAPYHSSCCTGCDWSGQPFYSDTDCTSWHTPVESGNLLLIKLFPFYLLIPSCSGSWFLIIGSDCGSKMGNWFTDHHWYCYWKIYMHLTEYSTALVELFLCWSPSQIIYCGVFAPRKNGWATETAVSK
jgi:hypothetical protein